MTPNRPKFRLHVRSSEWPSLREIAPAAIGFVAVFSALLVFQPMQVYQGLFLAPVFIASRHGLKSGLAGAGIAIVLQSNVQLMTDGAVITQASAGPVLSTWALYAAVGLAAGAAFTYVASAQREAMYREVLANIGKVMSSSLDMEEVYDHFAERLRTIIPFDQLAISIVDTQQGITVSSYVAGTSESDSAKPGESTPLQGSLAGIVVRKRSPATVDSVTREQIDNELPALRAAYNDGYRSFLTVPLVHRDDVVAVLEMRSFEPASYTSHYSMLAERVGNQIAGAIAIALMYAEREKTETALREAEQNYRTLVENANDSIVVLSGGEAVYRNPAYETLLGHEREGSEGCSFMSAVAPEHRDHILEYYEIRMAGGTPPDQYELELMTAEGLRVSMDVRPRIVEYDGKPATMLVMRNVTERKHLEEQLILAQKMEAVGQLAGGIAHDFNNLLSAVIGFAQLANLQLGTRGTVESSYLDEIQQAAERGAQLTRQLLAFSRRQVTEPKVLNLNDLIVNLDRMLRRLIGEHVELITLTAAELGAVRVDLGQMEQVLTNLVVNARDAMGEGGTLTIRTENVDLDDESARIDPELEPGKYVRVTVSDNGLGMKPDVAAHIFEPFFTTKGVGEGTGLGLSTCYGIVKQNGGHIAVESELNEGTTFKIFLPRLAETPEVLQADDSERAEGPLTGSETVLLVEDEPAVRKLTSEVLQNQGYRVLEATNGVEAVGVMEDDPGHRIDLLVTDVVMPAMGGRELAQRFRTSRPDGKVLYMSGYPDSMISRQGDVNLDGGFLQKPVTMVELARKVREMLDH